MIFSIAFIAVLVLLLTAVPGFILIKRKMVSEDCIPGLSKVMMYFCQPCLAIYTFKSATYSADKLLDLSIFALLAIAIHAIMLIGSWLILRKKYENAIYRIITIATACANCAFFGIPIIEALMGERAGDLIIYTTVYAVVLNVVCWTVGCAIISGDTKYITPKKIFLNPAMIGGVIAFVIFILSIPIQDDFLSMITTAGKMCSPLSMIIMGMRLATMDLKKMFCDLRVYLTIVVKGFVMPLVAFALVYFLPVSPDIKVAFFIISACPVASVVLNFSEMLGEGQKEAASLVLFGTMLSIVTLPIMMLLLPLLQ
ncbi:MAG: AEC family transporter [Clostridia bacterium]|nr:AEC family transporter [Clostridia bacterium]